MSDFDSEIYSLTTRLFEKGELEVLSARQDDGKPSPDVQLTHLPSGTTVTEQEYKSQKQNLAVGCLKLAAAVNETKKGKVLRAISRVKDLYPDWRIGQLVCNVAGWARGPKQGAVWDVEDDEFTAAVDEHLENQT